MISGHKNEQHVWRESYVHLQEVIPHLIVEEDGTLIDSNEHEVDGDYVTNVNTKSFEHNLCYEAVAWNVSGRVRDARHVSL
jgi:hypothetical protein